MYDYAEPRCPIHASHGAGQSGTGLIPAPRLLNARSPLRCGERRNDPIGVTCLRGEQRLDSTRFRLRYHCF